MIAFKEFRSAVDNKIVKDEYRISKVEKVSEALLAERFGKEWRRLYPRFVVEVRRFRSGEIEWDWRPDLLAESKKEALGMIPEQAAPVTAELIRYRDRLNGEKQRARDAASQKAAAHEKQRAEAAKRAAALVRSRAAFAKLKETNDGHLVESWIRFIKDATTTERALFEAVSNDAELRAAHDAAAGSTVVKTLASRIKKFFKLLEERGLVEAGKYGKKP